jgi:hypothetical protein
VLEALRNKTSLFICALLLSVSMLLMPAGEAQAHKRCFGNAGVGYIHTHDPASGPPVNWRIYKITQSGPNQIAKHFDSWVVNRYDSTHQYRGYVVC